MEIQIGTEVTLIKSHYSCEFAKTGQIGIVTDINLKAGLVEVKVEDGSLWMFYQNEVAVTR